MSREFIFYPGIKENGKYNCLYWKKENDLLVPADIYWASASFIDGQWFLDNGKQLAPTELHEDIVDTFAWSFDDDATLEEKQCFLYEIPLSALANAKPSRGLIEGYIPVEELKIFGQCEDIYDQQEFVAWNMSHPITPTIYADLPEEERRKYGKISFVDTYSPGYVSQVLSEVLSCTFNDNKCILMHYSF